MTCQSKLVDLLPLYATGTLAGEQRQALEEHLLACPHCRAELALWREVGALIVAEDAALPAPPPSVLARALAAARRSRSGALARAWALLCAQVPLVRREIWPASALVMGLGYLASIVAGAGQGASSIIQALAPLVAAAGLAVIYGQDNDPGLELALATPTSPRQVLLARLVLVFGYDLLLALAASVGLLAIVPAGLLGGIILGWLAPMTFLSALALVLSLCIGTGNAVTVALTMWLARGLAGNAGLANPSGRSSTVGSAALAYARAWQNPGLLFALASALLVAALWLAGRQEQFLARRAS